MSRRNGNSQNFQSRRNGSRRNGTNHRQNGSRRKMSRRNGSDSKKISLEGMVASHFVPRSFRTHFVVISYLLFGHFVPSNNHFVPRSFRTHFGHFVPRSIGYEMTVWWSIRTQVISYPFWSFRTHLGHFVPSKDGWIDGHTCFDWNDKLMSYS